MNNTMRVFPFHSGQYEPFTARLDTPFISILPSVRYDETN